MPTEEKPIEVCDLAAETERVKAEVESLLKALNGRRPSGALLLRARDLRKRMKKLGAEIERQIALDAAAAIAFRERCGREPEDGDRILPEDDRRAEQIVLWLQSRAANC